MEDDRSFLMALRPYARHLPSCAWLACLAQAIRDEAAMAAMVRNGCPECSCGFEAVLDRLPHDVRYVGRSDQLPAGYLDAVLEEASASQRETIERLYVALSQRRRADVMAMDSADGPELANQR